MARRTLTRAESKRVTRERLLASAARVLKKHGYHGASLAKVADEAGYTVGAVYSNFSGKEDLLLALIEQQSAEIAERVVAAAAGTPDALEKLRRGADEWMRFLAEHPELYGVFMEFWAVAVRNPAIARRNAELWGAVRSAIGSLIEQHAKDLGRALTMPAEQVGAAVMALADGLAIQRLESSAAIPDGLLGALLERLVPVLTEPGAGVTARS
jgi:AcrR family transcriptional regulator